MSMVRFEETGVEIAVESPALAKALEHAIEAALRDVPAPPRYPVVRLRTFRRLAALGSSEPGARIEGKIAVVRVTGPGLRRLPALVEAIRAAGALGVQLVWDGLAPPRERAEGPIFRVLEQARATKAGPPVMLAAERTPVLALRTAIAVRSSKP